MHFSPETSFYKALMPFNQAVSLPLGSFFPSPSPCSMLSSVSVALPVCIPPSWHLVTGLLAWFFRRCIYLCLYTRDWVSCFLHVPPKSTTLVARDICSQRDDSLPEDQVTFPFSPPCLLHTVLGLLFGTCQRIEQKLWEMARERPMHSFFHLSEKKRHKSVQHPAHVLHSGLASRGLLRIPHKS